MQQHFVHLHDMVSISVLPSFFLFLPPIKLPAVGQLSTVCATRPAGYCWCSFSYTFSTSLFLLVFPVHFFPHVCFSADLLCCILLLLFILFDQCFLPPTHLICIENVESICSDRLITYECDRQFLNGGKGYGKY